MSNISFAYVNKKLDSLGNQKIQSRTYKENTAFLIEMRNVYSVIREDYEKIIYQMLNNKHQPAIDFFKPIMPNIKRKIEYTDTLQLVHIVDEIDSIVSGFSDFLIKIKSIDDDIKEHKLMKSFLLNVSNYIKKSEVNQKSSEFDALVIDIRSQLNFFNCLNKFDILKNIYPNLRIEINQLIKSQKSNNYDDLTSYVKKYFPRIQTFTNEVSKLNNEIATHILMRGFIKNLRKNLNTTSFEFWQSQFTKKLKECQEDIRYHQGWRVGDYHCYGNGVILDTKTNLYWYQTNLTALSKQEANNKVAMFNKDLHHNMNSWRIPTVDECHFYSNSHNAGFLVHQCFWTNTKANFYYLIAELFRLCQKRFKKNWWMFLVFSIFFILFDIITLIFSKKYLCFNILTNAKIVNNKEALLHIMIVAGKKV